MAKTTIFLLTFLVVIAVPAGSAFSALSWYCHRLVPRFITYSVTPCTYPCLVVSRHDHPHIVVQNEPDGTPCMIPKGFNNGGELGTCRSSVCTQDLHHKVLKRKKRFICLYTVARIIQLRRQRKRLQSQIGDLQQKLARTSYRDEDSEGGRGVYGRESGGLGSGNTGVEMEEAFSPGNAGGLGTGSRESGFPESGNGNPEINVVGNPVSGGRSTVEGEFYPAGDMPNGDNGRTLPSSGAGADVNTVQARLGGLESGGLEVGRRNGVYNSANYGGNSWPGGERTVWHE